MPSSPSAAAAAAGGESNGITPKRLELSLNPADGSLLVAPLASVLLGTTDGLYQDMYNMAHGELPVTSAVQTEEADPNNGEDPAQQYILKSERLANLSFAQRRHEVSWRLAQHAKAVQHVSALCGAAAVTDLAHSVRISTWALQHARTAWVQADTAQDALYFDHAQLFPKRAAPHDVYGALDLLLEGRWYDLPHDLRLATDAYSISREGLLPKTELEQEWHIVVRQKLITGEVGWLRRKRRSALWKVALRGGTVKLTSGRPKTINGRTIYPLEALLSVLSPPRASPDPASAKNTDESSEPSPSHEWTLLSLHIHVQAKTGEGNHQLELSNRQRYDLHRLAALSMSREEARVRKATEDPMTADEGDTKGDEDSTMSRPLEKLFQVAHTFLLSWQLEVLSAQAQALRRGVWAATLLATNPVSVKPVHFYEQKSKSNENGTGGGGGGDNDDSESGTLGTVSIGFWKIDDSYGSPSMGDLHLLDNGENPAESNVSSSNNNTKSEQQLTLSIRAHPARGMTVSVSGGALIMEQATATSDDQQRQHWRGLIRDLLTAASDPFGLSASDALLAATRLCATLKCWAVVLALNQSNVLPDWLHVTTSTTNGSSIAVAARIYYHGADENQSTSSTSLTELFCMDCDARTGSFVATFPPAMVMVRDLAAGIGNLTSSTMDGNESLQLRLASVPLNRRRVVASNSSGRVVKDAFDGCIRSLNLLGNRTGVGGLWDDTDSHSAGLRERAIQNSCSDVKVALEKCCGMAAQFGLAPLAMGLAAGVQPLVDAVGPAIEDEALQVIPAPPVSLLLDQEIIETSKTTSDGVSKKSSHLVQSFFSVACSHRPEQGLYLVPLEVNVQLPTPSDAPIRQSVQTLMFSLGSTSDAGGEPTAKRAKHENRSGGEETSISLRSIQTETSYFVDMLVGMDIFSGLSD